MLAARDNMVLMMHHGVPVWRYSRELSLVGRLTRMLRTWWRH